MLLEPADSPGEAVRGWRWQLEIGTNGSLVASVWLDGRDRERDHPETAVIVAAGQWTRVLGAVTKAVPSGADDRSSGNGNQS